MRLSWDDEAWEDYGKLQAQISVLRMNEEGVITCALYVPKDLEL